jgi:hypothetical protein
MNPYNTLLKAILDAHVFRRNKRPLETKIDSCLPAVYVLTLLQSDDLPNKADRLEPCSCTLLGPLHEEHGDEGLKDWDGEKCCYYEPKQLLIPSALGGTVVFIFHRVTIVFLLTVHTLLCYFWPLASYFCGILC